MELVRSLERVEDVVVVRAPFADPRDAPVLHLARDEPSERLADTLRFREPPEVLPDVVCDLDARLPIRRRSRLTVVHARSPAVSSSHAASVARPCRDPLAYSRMRGTMGRSYV